MGHNTSEICVPRQKGRPVCGEARTAIRASIVDRAWLRDALALQEPRCSRALWRPDSLPDASSRLPELFESTASSTDRATPFRSSLLLHRIKSELSKRRSLKRLFAGIHDCRSF